MVVVLLRLALVAQVGHPEELVAKPPFITMTIPRNGTTGTAGRVATARMARVERVATSATGTVARNRVLVTDQAAAVAGVIHIGVWE